MSGFYEKENKKKSGIGSNLLSTGGEAAVKEGGTKALAAAGKIVLIVLAVILVIVIIVILIGIIRSVLSETGTIDDYHVQDDVLFSVYTSMNDIENMNSFVEDSFLASTDVNLIANANVKVYYGARIYPISGNIYSVKKKGTKNYSIVLTSNKITAYIDGITHLADEIDRYIRDMLIEQAKDEMRAEVMQWRIDYNTAINETKEGETPNYPKLPFDSHKYTEEEERELMLWLIRFNIFQKNGFTLPEPPIPEDYYNGVINKIEYSELPNDEYVIKYSISSSSPVAYAGRLPYYIGDEEPDESSETYQVLAREATNAPATLKLTVKLYDENGDKLSRFKTKMTLMAMCGFQLNGEYEALMGAKEYLIKCSHHLGLPYVWGADNLATGADCSGFTRATYKEYLGIEISNGARYQVREGVAITQEALRAGDLIFFKTDTGRAVDLGSPATHVGIYIGNDMFIHEAGVSTGCIISRFSGKYKDVFVAGKRFMKSTDYTINNWSVGIERIDREDVEALARLVEAECHAVDCDVANLYGNVIASYIYNKTICGKFQSKIVDTIANARELKSVKNGTYASYAPSEDAYNAAYEAIIGVDYVMCATYLKYEDDNSLNYDDKEYVTKFGDAMFFKD